MSRNRFNYPRFRYIKARLSIFARPSFFAALVFLSVTGFLVKEYWTNPGFLKFSENQESSAPVASSSNSQSLLSDEDRAIAADIGNLSVLSYDEKQASITASTTTNIDDSNQVKKPNDKQQVTKILDLAKKSQEANEIKSSKKLPAADISSASQQNPFLRQADNLLKFKFGNNQQNSSANNLSSLNSGLQTSQSSFGLGIGNNYSANRNQASNSESALQTAINQSTKNSQSQEKSAANTSTSQNDVGKLSQIAKNASSPNSSTNQRLLQNQTNSLVNTTIFNNPVNTQFQNPYTNFNNNQLPTNTYIQPGLANQQQNPYANFNNTQLPTNTYIQPGLANQQQNPYANLNNTQLPTNSYAQPNSYNKFNSFNNNQQQNPYRNFNRNQVSTNNYNQQTFNSQGQNAYNNLNNQITGTRYNAETQRRVNEIYNRLTNRNNPNVVTPNTYNLPSNSNNIGIQQPNNVQQFNGYRY